ncbi:epimerase [Pedobacter sp. HMWF019]|uniref:NAD-dependent epimerase/dehydratase family protein n=1 Tax=Pedobacter sp. HMWF019 TaxID=2056856 RepID=UPI000D3A158C|nr:NAD-dependent epimerase/dehydratase family protein [Pedobacter sp. HMWF019]PTS92201.1 epimerase [Pedobacter sp. HMWF019]
MKVILTGATGMVGEGVLMECIDNEEVTSVLYVGRRSSGIQHRKLNEYIVADFLSLREDNTHLLGFDACFYCAGVSSVGMNEGDYTKITYDTTLHFADVLLKLNPGMVFNFVSGAHTDSTEKGKSMWARVKGKTENALGQMAFRAQYNFRPGLMMPDQKQVQLRGYNKYIRLLYPLFRPFYTGCSTREIGKAMIAAVKVGYLERTLEARDIKKLAGAV